MSGTGERFPVVLYGRASVLARKAEPTNTATSVDDQLAFLREWARREGWPVIDEHRDDGISASRFNTGKERAGWQDVIGALESGQARGVLVYEFSRASRDMTVTNALEATCIATGAKIGYGGSLKDLSTTDGWFQVGLDGLMAARLSAQISENVTRAVNHRIAAGEPHGDVAFGYMIVRDGRGRTVERVEDPETGPIVREMVSRLLAGENAHSLAKDLNARGVTTRRGAKFTGGGLEAMLRNPTYAGFRTHEGAVIPDVRGTWPALIGVDDHLRVVARNEDPERDKFRNTTRTAHLGTGIFRCGRDGCEGRMRAMRRGRDKPFSYSCKDCAGVARAESAVDSYVTEHAVMRLYQQDFMAELHSAPDAAAQEQAVSDLARLDGEMSDARRMLEDPEESLSLADFTAWRKGWETRRKRAEDIARPSGLPDVVAKAAGAGAREAWEAMSIPDRRTALKWLLEVTILPAGQDNGQGFDPDTVAITWRDHTRT